MLDVMKILNNVSNEVARRKERKEELARRFELHKAEIVIYGHGYLGVELGKGLEHENWPVRYFLDANKPTDFSQKNINLKEANRYLSPDAIIIVAIYNIYLEYPSIRTQLEAMGFKNIMSVLDLRVWPELFQGGHIHDTLSWDITHIPGGLVNEAYLLMEDEASQKTYKELLDFFLSDRDIKFTLCPAEKQYMPDAIYLPAENERIIDCGAYNGDTMRAFYSRLGTWCSYTGIEPDLHNWEELNASIQISLPKGLAERTKTICAAVSNKPGSAAFCTSGNTTSHISEGPVHNVPVITLDDAIQEPVSFIKMDREGFELRALQGAEGLIRKNQPLLAICGYHHQADLWEIPLYMKKLLPNHKIYLRNYAGIIEYVFYAVPENRVLLK